MNEQNIQEMSDNENEDEDLIIPKEKNDIKEENKLIENNENKKNGLSEKNENLMKKLEVKKMDSKTKRKLNEQNDSLEKNFNDNCGNFSLNVLFQKALKNPINRASHTIDLENQNNSLSTRITEVLYNKYVEQNIQKSKHLDIYSKIKDEEIFQEREATKTPQDAKKINNMILRQEDYEKVKSTRKKGRQQEIKKKIKEVCFNPNGKKITVSRTPKDFYDDQQKFIKKKEEIITRISKNLLSEEQNTIPISKYTEKLANNKNPNETLKQFCKRLANEKLKNVREVLEAPKEEKKLNEKELKDLTEKLYKEGEIFKNNRIKMEQEQNNINKQLFKNGFVLQKSKKVLFYKFISIYENILNELFNKKDNFQIDFNEYVNILNHLKFIKPNSSNDNLVKESFNSLKPQNNKIDTYSFFLFALAALGIYKGNDEKTEDFSSTIKASKRKSIKLNQERGKSISLSNNINKKNQIKTSSEIIKSHFPNLDLEKYGFSGKECKIIKTKYLPFVSGISEEWAKELTKKKLERQDKLEETKKKYFEETKKLDKNKKEDGILDSLPKKNLKDEFAKENNNMNREKKKYKNIEVKLLKFEDMYDIFQKKKERKLYDLIEKKNKDFFKECTFQPNSRTKLVNKKNVAKTIEKLYNEGKKSYIQRKNQEFRDFDLDIENENNCTFKPMIYDYTGKYFAHNPLKENYKTYTKRREDKEYINKEILKQMSFEIEPKSNKDDISKRVISHKAGKTIEIMSKGLFGPHHFNEAYNNQNLLRVEINLDNKRKETIIISPEDNYIKMISDFCKKHKLKAEKKNKILGIINEQLGMKK